MKGVTSIPIFTCIIFLQTVATCLSAAKDDLSQHGSFIDFIFQPQDTVDDRLNPVILNCSIGIYSVDTNTFRKLTLPANITWYKNDIKLTEENISPKEQLFSNGSFKVYPRNHRTSNSASVSTYQCQAGYQNSVLLSREAIIESANLGQPTLPARRVLSACSGSSIYFNCTFNIANPIPVIKWYKNNRLIASNEKYVSNKDRVRSNHFILPSGVLEITEIRERDAGKYTCYAENIAGRKKGNQYTLEVTSDCSSETSSHDFLMKPQSQSGVVGERVVLQCSASVGSGYTVKWLKNLTRIDFISNEHLRNFQLGNTSLRVLRTHGYDESVGKFRIVGQHSLMVTNLTLADSGQYFCYVYDNNSTSIASLTASATLSVLEPPRFLEQSSQSLQAYLGCHISFVCNVTGSPRPTITWYKNGVLLRNADDISIVNNSVTTRVISRYDDAAVYQCFANNQAGSIQRSFQLHVIGDDLDDANLNDVLSGDGMLRLIDSTPSSATLTWSLFGLLQPTGYRIEWIDTVDNRRGVISTPVQPRTGSLDNLKGGRTVTVSVISFTPICEGPRSKAITFITPQQEHISADMIRNLAVEALSSTGLWITWQAPLNQDDDIKYKIAMWETNEDPSTAKEVLTTHNSQEYQGLQKYTSYSVKVAVVDENGDVGSYSSPVALRTLEDIPDEPPTNITATPKDIGSVMIRWSPPPSTSINGEIRGYNIKYKDIDSRDKNTVVNLDGDMTQYLLKDLRSNAEYSVRIQIRNGVGSSAWTKRIYFETSEDPKLETRAPGKPALLDTKTGSTEMMVMWAPPDDDIIVREYEIGWGETGPYEHVDKTEASQRYFRITGLMPATEYFISVRAGNKAGQGEEFHIDVRTKAYDDDEDEPYPPLNVHVTVLTATTLNVTWHNTAREEQARYLVRYKTNVPEEPRVRFLNSSDISCIIHGLRPYTVYDISVKLVVGNRQSTWSMTETARTKESKPGTPPTDLTVMPIEGKEGIAVQLNWQPPVEPNGELDGYRVFYTTSPSSNMDGWVLEPVKGDKLSTTVDGLEEDAHYYFKALARNKQGVGPYSEVVEYQTPTNAQATADSSTPFNLSKPVWYLIIGGAVLLLIIVVVIVIIVVYRKKRVKNEWNYSRGKSSSGVDLHPINGVRSSSSTSWPLSSNLARTSLRQLPPHNKQFELHSLHSPTSRFTQEEFPNFCPNLSPEAMPLTETQYRYDYQRVPASSPLHDPLRPPITASHPYSPNGDHYNQETHIPLHRDISCEMEHYPGYHVTHRGASVTTPTQIDPTGDSAYGSDHQHCHLADNPHHDPGDVSLPRSQNQYLQSNQRSNHQRSSSLSISACSTTGSGSFSSLDSNDPALSNVQQFLDDMRIGNTVM